MANNEKIAIITGGSKGIGRAIAEGFLERNIPVHLLARTYEDLVITKSELERDYETEINIHSADANKTGDIENIIDSVVEPTTELYFINNAGTYKPFTIGSDFATFQEVQETNFLAPMRITNYLVTKFSKEKNAKLHLLTTLSQAALRVLDEGVAYGASKVALMNATIALEEEVKRNNINNINFYRIYPATVATPYAIKMYKEGLFGAPTSMESVVSTAMDLLFKKTPTKDAFIGNVQEDMPSLGLKNERGIVRVYLNPTSWQPLFVEQSVVIDKNYKVE